MKRAWMEELCRRTPGRMWRASGSTCGTCGWRARTCCSRPRRTGAAPAARSPPSTPLASNCRSWPPPAPSARRRLEGTNHAYSRPRVVGRPCQIKGTLVSCVSTHASYIPVAMWPSE
eukprot:3799358-Pyramimonas_sp.AAC.1